MMVAEEILADDIDAGLQDVFGKSVRVANATEHGRIPSVEFAGIINLAGGEVAQARDAIGNVHHRNLFTAEAMNDSLHLRLIEWAVGACNDDCISALEAIKRLAQATERHHLETAEGIARIKQQDVQIARQLQMLIGIVKHKHL